VHCHDVDGDLLVLSPTRQLLAFSLQIAADASRAENSAWRSKSRATTGCSTRLKVKVIGSLGSRWISLGSLRKR
jgi:hypothetical protein